MEQALWPEDYERMTREVEEALREADDPNTKLYPHEEVMQAMQERIDQTKDKSCCSADVIFWGSGLQPLVCAGLIPRTRHNVISRTG